MTELKCPYVSLQSYENVPANFLLCIIIVKLKDLFVQFNFFEILKETENIQVH